jgi:hypothetical protein
VAWVLLFKVIVRGEIQHSTFSGACWSSRGSQSAPVTDEMRATTMSVEQTNRVGVSGGSLRGPQIGGKVGVGALKSGEGGASCRV